MGSHRTAIVTGAGKRVGAFITKALLADGWTVVGHVHHAKDSVPTGAIKVVADLAEPGCADIIFAAGTNPVRLLVNNAARFVHDGFGAFDVEQFGAHMAINVRAPVLLAERFAAAHDGTSDALIVNLLDAKLTAPNPDYLSYTMSKQALAGFTELAARALATKGIRVNAIAPALMVRSLGQSASNFATLHSANPLGRGVEQGDVVTALRYLIAAPAVTGQVLTIDAGQRFWSLERDVQFLARSDSPGQLEE